jgi:hypothetical protein
MNENISKHITYKEAVFSQTAIRKGIKNEPNKTQLAAMKKVAENIFEKLRAHFGKPIRISSFYRSIELNKAIGGSATSQHCLGQAIDIQAISGTGITNKDLFNYTVKFLDFDQIIWEFGNDDDPEWVHISWVGNGKNRKKITRAIRSGNAAKYIDFVPEILLTLTHNKKYKKGIVNVDKLNFRSTCEINKNNIISILNKNSVVDVVSKTGSWYKIIYNHKQGFVNTRYLSLIE